MYGAGRLLEFTGYPDLSPRDEPDPAAAASAAAGPPAPAPAATNGPPIVDVTLRMQEGKQYFVNRITFTGNTTTRDNVIRREMRLVESGVFNTEALEVQRQAAESAGLLQERSKGKRSRSRRRPAPTTRSTSS